MVNTIKMSEFADIDLANTQNQLVGIDSPSGGDNIKSKFPLSWSTSTRPSTPGLGISGFNTDSNSWEFWNGSSWLQFAAGGSGTVNAGLENQLAFYAVNGSAVSGINTLNDGLLKTDNTGSPLWSTTTPSALTIPQPKIGGITNGSAAGLGEVGQIISSFIDFGSSVAALNNTATNVTSIALTAGQWLISGNVIGVDNSNQMTAFSCWSSSISATQPDSALTSGFNAGSTHLDLSVFASSIPTLNLNISSPQTYYLSGTINSLVGSNLRLAGGISAIRVR